MAKFGERYAGVDNNILQVDYIDERLRNKIWSVVCLTFFDNFFEDGFNKDEFAYEIQVDFFGLPKDDISKYKDTFQKSIKKRYYELEWYQVYELIEFLCCRKQCFVKKQHYPRVAVRVYCAAHFSKKINEYLEEEKSGYRLLDLSLIKITDEYELQAIAEAHNLSDKFAGARKHIKQAAEHFSRRENPDYRNSIKESISAIESVYRTMSGENHANIGDAIKYMDSKGLVIPKSLKSGFSNIYGWTSSAEGLRHAILDGDAETTENEAKLMLVLCSGYVNYLVARSIELET